MKKNATIVVVLLTFFSLFLPFAGKANFGENGIHDPSSIIKYNGVYHVWGSGNQVAHLTSTDLVNWKTAPAVFPEGTWPSWINTYVPGFAGNFRAPESVFMNGKYYLYYSVSMGQKPSAIGVATSTDLVNWTDQGMVVHSDNSTPYGSIDPAVFADANNNYWMTFGSHLTGIWITQIDPTTGKRLNNTLTNIAGTSNSEHEAPFITYENGYYYLFYNVGTCCALTNSTYTVKMGRSASPTGPYLDKSGVPLLGGGGTTVLGASGKYIGPGHFGLFRENSRNILTMHYYDGTSNGYPRLDVATLKFGNDGWPVATRDVLPNGRYKITNRNSNLAWAALECTGQAGQKLVQQTPDDANLCQQWDLTSVGDGFYKLKNAKTVGAEQVVDVPFCNTANGTLLGTWDWLNNDCQKFKIEQLANGSYVFSPIGNANRVIEVPSASTASGAQLGLFDYNGCTCQQWSVTILIVAPVTLPAENVTTNSFTAKWEAVPDAVSYKLDVSANPNFTTFLTGYNDLDVTGTSKVVTGLSASGGYFYRVRAVMSSTVSPNSNVTGVATAGAVDNGMHDPSNIVKEGGTYWMYGTGFTNGDGSIVPFTISSSTDLFKWTRGTKSVFAPGTWPSWINTVVPNFGGIFWAPEIIYMNGQYYLYYSVSAFGSSTSAIGLATSPTLDQSSPAYEWTDRGMVVSSNSSSNVNAIDAAVLKDTDGRVWLSYGSFSAGIGVVELDAATGLRKAGASITVVAGGNRSAWEAPYLMKEGNYYYLFVNRQYCCALLNSTYYLVVGRSTSPTGPFTDKNGNSLLVTSSGTVVGTTVLETSGKYVGPGHFGLLRDNGRNIVSTHYYDATSNGYPRVDIANLKFSPDGWPVITRDLLPEGRYKITNKNSNLVWEAAGCTGAGGQQLVQNVPDANALCQQWDLTPVGDGYYRLKNANGGSNTQVVDIPFCNVNNKLATWDWLNNDCQKFRIDQLANGSYVFSPYVNGSMVIEVPFASNAPNTQLALSAFNGHPGQQWSIDSFLNTPVALNADSIAPTGFKAQWNAVPNASGYKVDVYTSVNTSAVPASTVAGWNFESGTNGAQTGSAANIGKTVVSGGGVGTTVYNSSGTAMATGWNGGNGTKYWEAVNISTKGFYSLKVSSVQRSNSTGPRHFKLQYKIGATGAYADVPGGYVTTADNYTSGKLTDVPLPSICENQPSVYLRWLMVTNTNVGNNTNTTAGTVAGSGQSNIDDIVVTGVNFPIYTFVAGYEDITVAGTSLNVTGLTANTDYYYRVRSIVGGVASGNSNVIKVKTACDTVITNAVTTNITCNGADDGAITLSVTGGSGPYTYSWTGPGTFTSTEPGISNLKPGDYKVTITQKNGCAADFMYSLSEPAAINFGVTKTDVSMSGSNDGSITATFDGGTAPYQVKLDTGTYTAQASPYTFSGLAAGTYTVYVKDNNGCEKTAEITVGIKTQQTITFNALAEKLVGDADFDPGATATSGLPVSYSSSNTAVATIINGMIHITGTGTTTITASQAGNDTFNAAIPVMRTLTVKQLFYQDYDRDTYGNSNVPATDFTAPVGYTDRGGDCNDKNSTVHPGAPELADNLDNNCNGQVDETLVLNTYYQDYDRDGYGNENATIRASIAPVGYVTVGGDCNDKYSTVHPGATEISDNLDNNCNGRVDEGLSLTTFYQDYDRDGYGNNNASIRAGKMPGAGWVTIGGDCSDKKSWINPGATEVLNGIDDNCNGLIDEGLKADLVAGQSLDETVMGARIKVSAAPNPSAGRFTLTIQGNKNQPVQVRVINILGSVVEQRLHVVPNSTIQIGGNYQTGVYFVEVRQGEERIIKKLIKE